jgi:hypothetical protein
MFSREEGRLRQYGKGLGEQQCRQTNTKRPSVNAIANSSTENIMNCENNNIFELLPHSLLSFSPRGVNATGQG